MENPDQNQLENWHNDPNNWKWGVFYYNPEDPRLFLPKRIQWMGITVNFAKPSSLLFVLGIILLVVFILYFLPSHTN